MTPYKIDIINARHGALASLPEKKVPTHRMYSNTISIIFLVLCYAQISPSPLTLPLPLPLSRAEEARPDTPEE